MKLEIIKGSVVDSKCDVIVNAANEGLQAGGGVCGAIFSAAGFSKLQRECNAIGWCKTGHAVMTNGYNLKAKHIIHAGDVYMMKADTYDIDATLDELRALTSVEKRIDDDKVTIVDNGDKKIKESLEKND